MSSTSVSAPWVTTTEALGSAVLMPSGRVSTTSTSCAVAVPLLVSVIR